MNYRLTPKRRAWLERLREEGQACRARTNVGYACMQAGWTEWYVKFKDGREMPMSQARALYSGPDLWDRLETGQLAECLTAKGVEAIGPPERPPAPTA